MVPRSALEVPQVLSRGGVVSGKESLGVAGKDQASAGGQDARNHRRARLDVPLDGAGRRVNRLERPRCLAVNQRERAPPIRLSLDEERLSRSELGAIIDDRYIRVTRAGVIGHGVPFLAAGGAGADPHALFRGQCGRVHKRAARFRIESVGSLLAVGPVDLAERFAVEKCSVLAIQAIEIPVAMRLDQRLDRFAVAFDVDQHGCVHAVIIPDVVRAILKMPFIGAVVGIEGDDGASVQVVSRPHFAVEVGRGIADSPVQRVQIGIVSARNPGRPAAGQP